MVRGKCFFLIQGLACSYIYFVTRIKLIKLITVTKRQHLIENGEKQEKSYHTQKPCLHCHRITWFSSTSDRWFFPTYRWLFLSSYFWLDQKPHISIRDLNKKKKSTFKYSPRLYESSVCADWQYRGSPSVSLPSQGCCDVPLGHLAAPPLLLGPCPYSAIQRNVTTKTDLWSIPSCKKPGMILTVVS